MPVEIAPPGGTVTVLTPTWTATAAQDRWDVEVIADVAVAPTYRGAYEVVPSSTAQTLATDGLMMDGDVTIGAVPSNYGLITYNGSTITVS